VEQHVEDLGQAKLGLGFSFGTLAVRDVSVTTP
jgi:hypothetical protein